MALDLQRIPRHVALIMDGNGRWAKARGLPRIKGHEEGANSVRTILRESRRLGVEHLTLYAFSLENWVRPRAEVQALMLLLRKYLTHHEKELHENETRFRAIGRLDAMPKAVRREIDRVTAATAAYTRHSLTLALSYGGRAELADAAQAIAAEVKAGTLQPQDVDEAVFAQHLYAPELPDPDLMIRTSGEQRISNFLLWQLSYAEFVFVDANWPDFREAEFVAALEEYQQRHRRFGDVK